MSLQSNTINVISNTCDRILNLEDFNINMVRFISEDNECNTSYCIAGRLAEMDKFPIEYYRDTKQFHFEEYSYTSLLGWKESDIFSPDGELVDSDKIEVIWHWLFSGCWPDNLEHAKERARILKENLSTIQKLDKLDSGYTLNDRPIQTPISGLREMIHHILYKQGIEE